MGILRKMFGPSRAEIWRQLSAEIGGQYLESFWKGDKVQATHGEWTVTLDTYAVHAGKTMIVFTRLRAPFVNPGGFRFKIYRKRMFSELGKMLGMQDVEVGHSQFDEDFIIQGNDEMRLRELFANARIRELISAQKEISFEVKDDEGWFGPNFPEGVDELCFTVLGIVKDVERLKLLYELLAETLDQLCRIGSAYEKPAGVVL